MDRFQKVCVVIASVMGLAILFLVWGFCREMANGAKIEKERQKREAQCDDVARRITRLQLEDILLSRGKYNPGLVDTILQEGLDGAAQRFALEHASAIVPMEEGRTDQISLAKRASEISPLFRGLIQVREDLVNLRAMARNGSQGFEALENKVLADLEKLESSK